MNFNKFNPKVSAVICIVAAVIIFALAIFQISLVQDIHSLRIKQNQQKSFSYDQARKNYRYRAEFLALFDEQDKVVREAVVKLHKGLMNAESVNVEQCETLFNLYNMPTQIDVWNLQTGRANQTYRKMLPNIVSMKGEYRVPFGKRYGIYGTGFFINERYILTVGHVSEALIDGTEKAVLYDNTEIDVEFVAEENLPDSDLALFRFDPNDINDYNVSNIILSTDVPLVGETIFMIGSSLGYNNILTVGTFSRLIKGNELKQPCTWACDIYLEDVQAEGGNSGSPVFNAECEVVSIHIGHFCKYAVSIPAYTIVEFLEDNGVYNGDTSTTN